MSFADEYGSGGRLFDLVVMDDLGKYPSDPVQRANGENSTLTLVGPQDRPPLGSDPATRRNPREKPCGGGLTAKALVEVPPALVGAT